MEAPVNFDNLHTITGGDAEMLASVGGLFIEDAESCLEGLRNCLVTEDEAAWRSQAHAFKGACMNMGAPRLTQLCSQAQMDWRAALEDKKIIFQKIEDEFACVTQAIAEMTQAKN